MLGFSPLASTTLANDVGGIRYAFTADAGSFALTGQDAGLSRGRRFEFSNRNTSIVLSQSGPNGVIISAVNNEAA